jgi:splicing factor 4
LYNFRFIFEKTCLEYKEYRREVTERRKINKSYDEIEAYRNKPSRSGPIEPKIFGSTQESKTKTVTIIRNDDSESTNSDTDTWKEAKERNLKNLKRKVLHVRRKKQCNVSTTDSSDDNQQEDGEQRRLERKHKMSSASSSSSANSKKDNEHQEQMDQQEKSSDTGSRPKRKKSRWGEAPPAEQSQPPMSIVVTPTQNIPKPMLSTVTRTDPALLQYARQNFGTTNLTEDDWKKAEEHYKINLLFQDMQRKRQEIDKLARNGKFKYEYDSDEDTNGGTWEHKIRSSEMEATLKWAEALNKQCEGKHHIGDFLPPEELKKFMEKYNSQKLGRAPDVSDYKDFKLKEDNKGYQMLQKMGWKGEGTSLGSTGSGITEPINK